jgi:hypothetical protein
MIRFTRLRLRHSSGTATLQHSLLQLHLCRIDFPPTKVAGTATLLVWRLPALAQKPPKWIPTPASCTFSLKNWPYGDGPV